MQSQQRRVACCAIRCSRQCSTSVQTAPPSPDLPSERADMLSKPADSASVGKDLEGAHRVRDVKCFHRCRLESRRGCSSTYEGNIPVTVRTPGCSSFSCGSILPSFPEFPAAPALSRLHPLLPTARPRFADNASGKKHRQFGKTSATAGNRPDCLSLSTARTGNPRSAIGRKKFTNAVSSCWLIQPLRRINPLEVPVLPITAVRRLRGPIHPGSAHPTCIATFPTPCVLPFMTG